MCTWTQKGHQVQAFWNCPFRWAWTQKATSQTRFIIPPNPSVRQLRQAVATALGQSLLTTLQHVQPVQWVVITRLCAAPTSTPVRDLLYPSPRDSYPSERKALTPLKHPTARVLTTEQGVSHCCNCKCWNVHYYRWILQRCCTQNTVRWVQVLSHGYIYIYIHNAWLQARHLRTLSYIPNNLVHAQKVAQHMVNSRTFYNASY